MYKTQLSALILLSQPLQTDNEFLQNAARDVFQEIIASSEKMPYPIEDAANTPVLQIWDASLPGNEYYNLTQRFLRESKQFLLTMGVSAIVEYDDIIPIDTFLGKLEPSSKASFKYKTIGIDFAAKLSNIILAANLARPGSLGVSQVLILQDGEAVRELSEASSHKMSAYGLASMQEYVQNNGWPEIFTIQFLDVWNWLIKRQIIVQGFSDNSADRALTAISYLFEYHRGFTPIYLFWAVLGIEALYVRDKENIQKQVLEKSRVFLGEKRLNKKKVKTMYEFRSLFIHGKMNFPHRAYDYSPEFLKYFNGLNESRDLAIAILIATIQSLIIRGWKGLDYPEQEIIITDEP